MNKLSISERVIKYLFIFFQFLKLDKNVCGAGHHVLLVTLPLLRLICTVCESEHTLRHSAGSGDIWKSRNTTEAYTFLSVKNRHQVTSTDDIILLYLSN